MNAYASTFETIADVLTRAAYRPRKTLADALREADDWGESKPPIDVTHDPRADAQLAQLFGILLYVGDRDLQLRVLYANVELTTSLPPSDPFQKVIRRWWLDLYHDSGEAR